MTVREGIVVKTSPRSAWESLFRDHFVEAAGHDPDLAQSTGT
jgi:hypothetical protein